MIAQTSHEPGAIRVETEQLVLEIELAPLRVALRSRDAAVRATGLSAYAETGRGRLGLDSATCTDSRVETPEGPGTRVSLSGAAREGLVLDWTLDLPDRSSAVFLEVGVRPAEGGSPTATRVTGLVPFSWTSGPGSALELPRPQELEWTQLGDRPSAFAGTRRLDGARQPPTDWCGSPRLRQRAKRTRRGHLDSSAFAELAARGEGGLALGFTTHDRLHTRLELDHRRARLRSLRAVAYSAGRPAPLRSEQLFVALTDPSEDALVRWAGHCARGMRSGRSTPGPATWQPPGGDANALREGLGHLAARSFPVDEVCVCEPAPGPEVREAVRQIRAAGARPALRIRPFGLSVKSPVSKERAGWLRRDAAGAPLRLDDPEPHFLLDTRLPEVRAYLRARAADLRDAGFTTFALDGLADALWPAGSSPPSAVELAQQADLADGVPAYREGLRALREGAGTSVRLVGIDAPLGASLGLLDALALPQLVSRPRGQPSRWLARLRGSRVTPPPPGFTSSLLVWARLHGRLVGIEAGIEPASLGGYAGLGPLLAIAGVDLRFEGAAPDDPEAAARLLPASGRPAERVPTVRPGIELRRVRGADAALAIAVANLGARRETLTLAPSELGLAGPLHRFDVHPPPDFRVPDSVQRSLETLGLGSLEPGEAAVLRLAPLHPELGLVGSTLHHAAGLVEVRACHPAGEGLRVTLQVTGTRCGSLLFARDAGPRRAVHVTLDGPLELEVDARTLLPEPRE